MYSKTDQLAQKKPKKKKIKSRHKQLVQACDQLVREIIARRDSRCCTCKAPRGSRRLDVGHYITRSKHCLRWDLRNCNAQCEGCNLIHEHNTLPYTIWITGMYGFGILEEFDNIIREHTRFGVTGLEVIKAGLEEELASYPEEKIEINQQQNELLSGTATGGLK